MYIYIFYLYLEFFYLKKHVAIYIYIYIWLKNIVSPEILQYYTICSACSVPIRKWLGSLWHSSYIIGTCLHAKLTESESVQLNFIFTNIINEDILG